jgi:hypothetical protein
MVQTAEIIIRLYAALPTMVDGPSSPAGFPRRRMDSTMASRISGALQQQQQQQHMFKLGPQQPN